MPSTPIHKHYRSWGRYPKASHRQVVPVQWRNALPNLGDIEGSVLPFGYGRSYGDSCLNNGGTLLDTTHLNHILGFDDKNGLLRCEAGVSLAEIVALIVPRGWFLPVTPGTKFVSVAGAIANDVHGKNHYARGTFGRFVTQFELVRSSGERLICSPTENVDLFKATIGGLGLTGMITWAEFRLKPIPSPLFDVEYIRFANLDEFYTIDAESVEKYEYTVSWVDALATGKNLGRGVYMRGQHYDPPLGTNGRQWQPLAQVPLDAPEFLLNTWSMKAFNIGFYSINWRKRSRKIMHYEPYFYPLDILTDWNRMYGQRGFLQYQFCIPDQDRAQMQAIFHRIAHSGEGVFLTVFKRFGDLKSPGMLSFPQPGITLALDFANTPGLHPLLDDLDAMVREVGGRVYPAKDAHMSSTNFKAFYPNWEAFAQYIDPKFSSSFWRRVMGTDETIASPVAQEMLHPSEQKG
jgi:FAD/FMN-containing dehydrogenase